MIIVGLGTNLASERHGPPLATLERALGRLAALGVIVARRSRWYRSAPMPPAPDQPCYVNGVAIVATDLEPAGLLALLHCIEAEFGRVRSAANAARVLDLDLLAYGQRIGHGEVPGEPILPHPRLAERSFVLCPLAELLPAWRHPVTGRGVDEMLARLAWDQRAEPIDESG